MTKYSCGRPHGSRGPRNDEGNSNWGADESPTKLVASGLRDNEHQYPEWALVPALVRGGPLVRRDPDVS